MRSLSKRLFQLLADASLLFPATVALAYVSSFLSGGLDLAGRRGQGCVALGVIYALLGNVDYALLRLRLRLWRRVAYLGVQSGLLVAIYLTSHMADQMWLCGFPLVVVAVVLFRPLAATLAVVALFGLTAGLAHHFYGMPFGPFSFSMLPAFGFIAVFTRVSIREKAARLRAESLSAELERLAVIQERNRLAREIHDSLGHFLTTIHVQLEAAQAIHAADPGRALEAVAKAQGLAREALVEVRRSVAALQADMAPAPLVARLRDLAAVTDGWGAAVSLDILGETRSLAPEAEHALFRAAQEGLTNVRKHARARTAWVALDYRESGRVVVRVSDDGCGAAPGAAGCGLEGVRERIASLGGSVRTENPAPGGFLLHVEIPG
jgi:signal transduction histidine kinase